MYRNLILATIFSSSWSNKEETNVAENCAFLQQITPDWNIAIALCTPLQQITQFVILKHQTDTELE